MSLKLGDRMPFGKYGPKHKNGAQLVSTVLREDPDYLNWWAEEVERYPLSEEVMVELDEELEFNLWE